MTSFFSPEDRLMMENDLTMTGVSSQTLFDIRRSISTVDTTLGGVTISTTAIETRSMELQHLIGRDVVAVGGRRIEADYKGICKKVNVDLREKDIITPNSGTTIYEILFIENLWPDHIEFFAKRAS